MSQTLTRDGLELAVGEDENPLFADEPTEEEVRIPDDQIEAYAEAIVAMEKSSRIIEADRVLVQSIFDNKSSIYSWYKVTAQFYDQILGGTPSNPQVLESHLRKTLGMTDESRETYLILRQVLKERLGVEDDLSDDEMDRIVEASKAVAKQKSTNGFRRDKDGLFIPSLYVKAMLKEATNILYGGIKVGPTRKGSRNYLAERVFVANSYNRIHLGREVADDVVLIIGHVDGPQGKRSTLAHHESCIQPEVEFVFGSVMDSISHKWWNQILELSQDLGLGACRSQGYGRFAVTSFEPVSKGKVWRDRPQVGDDMEDLLGAD